MFDIKSLFVDSHPQFYKQYPTLTGLIVSVARFLWKEKEFKAFARKHDGKRGVELIKEGFRQINFDFSVSAEDLAKVPLSGPVVIIANHPVGYLDGIGLLKVISDVRKDIRLVVNSALHSMLGMTDLTIPVDNFNGAITRQSLKQIKSHMKDDGVLIIFPSGTVSRYSNGKIRDMDWNPSFLRFASQYHAPLIPVYIHAKNSSLYYFLSIIAFPLAQRFLLVRELLQMKLIREMFSRHRNQRIPMLLGNTIDIAELDKSCNTVTDKMNAVREQLYELESRL